MPFSPEPRHKTGSEDKIMCPICNVTEGGIHHADCPHWRQSDIDTRLEQDRRNKNSRGFSVDDFVKYTGEGEGENKEYLCGYSVVVAEIKGA
jgi:hypothetical protein